MKLLQILWITLVASCVLWITPAYAAGRSSAAEQPDTAVIYCDEYGNPVTVDGLYYNTQGQPCFNAECFYLDADNNPVYVGGCLVYCRDADGFLNACRYYYDAAGEAVLPPASYTGGCGYGTWCYGADGAVLGGSFYYDDFGNPVEPPANYGSGRGGRGGYGAGSYRGRCCH